MVTVKHVSFAMVIFWKKSLLDGRGGKVSFSTATDHKKKRGANRSALIGTHFYDAREKMHHPPGLMPGGSHRQRLAVLTAYFAVKEVELV